MLFFGKSDVGKTRAINEDNFVTLELCDNFTLYVVCDGIGGHKGGEVASKLAVITFTDYIKTHLGPFIASDKNELDMNAVSLFNVNIEDVLMKAVSAANITIRQRANYDRKLKDMGTTLVAAVVINNTLYAANVGDSRLYHIDDGEVKQITHDHSYVQYLMDIGQITPEEAVKNKYRNVITRAVGTTSFLETDPDIYKLEFASGFILLCSDGLYNYSNHDEYGEFLSDVKDMTTLESAVDNLVDDANNNGGEDNITVIVAKSFDKNTEPTGNN
jgi:Serine/threonine protein phosphatase